VINSDFNFWCKSWIKSCDLNNIYPVFKFTVICRLSNPPTWRSRFYQLVCSNQFCIRPSIQFYNVYCHSKLPWQTTATADFIDSNNLMPMIQSAYLQGHSTETAVTKIYNLTCCLLQTLANWPLSVYSTLQRRSTLSTITNYCFGWNGSSVSEELCSSGIALPFWQVFSCALQQSDILHCLHCVLCVTRVDTGSASYYFLHG